MNDSRRPFAGLRRAAHRRLVGAYATVIIVTGAVLWAGSAWVADTLALQAASESGAASASAELSCANQILGYAVNIGSAPADSLPVQIVVNLQQAAQRCDQAWHAAAGAASGMTLDQSDSATLARLSMQVNSAHDDMSAAAHEVIADAQSGDLSQRSSLGAAVTRLAAKVATYVDATRAEVTDFSDLSNGAVSRARLKVVTIASAVIGILVLGFAGFIAPLHRRNAALIEASARSHEQDRRLGSDIARHIAERDRNEAQAQFKALFQQSSVGVALCGLDGVILESNAALQGMLGSTSDELLNIPFGSLFAAAEQSVTGENDDGERLLRRSDGTQMWVEQTTTQAKASDNRTIAVIRMIQNIEGRKKAEERLRFDATHDALTGLHNRRYFDDAVDEAVAEPGSNHAPSFAVLMVDLDGFKYINDTRGHAIGDAALSEFGRRLGAFDGPDVLVCRYGGDEFTVLVRGIQASDTAIELAQAIQSALHEPLAIQGTSVFLSSSIGICQWSADFTDGDALLQAADSAVYKAKSAGKGRWAVYDTSMAKVDRYRRSIGADLRAAVDGDELDIAYQPIVLLADGKCIGFESLARWRHPKLGPISPADFIPVAEEMGLVGDIGKWMLRRACQQLASWRAVHGLTDIKINVNVSPQQMADSGFAALVAATLAEMNLDPKKIALELTETAIFESRGQGSRTLDELRRIGTPIMLDDFGTGYSSLAHLRNVRMDALKIDQTFVRGDDGGLASPPIVQMLVALAKTLGIDVVAEGVETQRQATLLRAMGCQAAQGYLYSHPLSATEAIEYLLGRSTMAANG